MPGPLATRLTPSHERQVEWLVCGWDLICVCDSAWVGSVVVVVVYYMCVSLKGMCIAYTNYREYITDDVLQLLQYFFVKNIYIFNDEY